MSKINLWSIQNLRVMEDFDKTDSFVTHRRFISSDFITAYDWLKKQMEERLKIKLDEQIYPVWAWNTKPDLRRTGYLPKGEKGVRLMVSVNLSKVLFSDFYQWHCVLAKHYLATSETDEKEFHDFLQKKGLQGIDFDELPDNIQEIIIHSWERIFEINRPNIYWSNSQGRLLQATLPFILREEVFDIKKFTAR